MGPRLQGQALTRAQLLTLSTTLISGTPVYSWGLHMVPP
jgi:hypothetical protein